MIPANGDLQPSNNPAESCDAHLNTDQAPVGEASGRHRTEAGKPGLLGLFAALLDRSAGLLVDQPGLGDSDFVPANDDLQPSKNPPEPRDTRRNNDQAPVGSARVRHRQEAGTVTALVSLAGQSSFAMCLSSKGDIPFKPLHP